MVESEAGATRWKRERKSGRGGRKSGRGIESEEDEVSSASRRWGEKVVREKEETRTHLRRISPPRVAQSTADVELLARLHLTDEGSDDLLVLALCARLFGAQCRVE